MRNTLIAGCVGAALVLTACGTTVQTNNNLNEDIQTSSGQSMNENTNNANTFVPEEMIRITSPMPNAVLDKEVRVSGQARAWYFEGSFPVEVVDTNGVKLYEGSLSAIGDWMTSDFVPFEGNFALTGTPTAPTGKIIFIKSNPSDLPEFDAQFELPVRFQNN